MVKKIKTKRSGKEFFKRQYGETFKYLFSIKNNFKIVFYLFLFSALVGFFVPLPEALSMQIFEYIEDIISQTEGFVFIDWFGFIFLNNLQSSFFSLLGGFFLGIFPIIATLVNGFLLGFVSNWSVSLEGVISLWRLFPHGIFELPAIFISFACGLKLGMFVFHKDMKKAFKESFIGGMKVFLLVVLPLLLVAAIIESAFIYLG